MNIEEVRHWLIRNDRDPAWLARKAGVDRTHLWRVVHGERPFAEETRRKVTEAIRNWNSSTA